MLINLTPHAIHFVFEGEDGEAEVTFAPAGVPARCTESREKVNEARTDEWRPPFFVPVYRSVFGDVEGLPDQRPGTFYIVSRAVAEACPDRPDLLFPYDTLRDQQGRIVGCRAFGTVARAWATGSGDD